MSTPGHAVLDLVLLGDGEGEVGLVAANLYYAVVAVWASYAWS